MGGGGELGLVSRALVGLGAWLPDGRITVLGAFCRVPYRLGLE